MSKSDQLTTAFAYARFSSDNQRHESIDAQMQAIQEYAKREGIHIARIFTDEAESARYDDRPGFQSLIDAARMEPPDMVLVHKLDRFSRNRYDAAVYRRKLKDYGVRLISVLEPLDGSPESIILESVLEGMAEYYSKNLAREVMKGMRQTAQKGRWCGGKPPLGYLIGKDQKLVVDKEKAPLVKRIFELYLQGYGYKAIAIRLNEEGYKTSVNGSWYKSSIHTILTNERYTGTSVFNHRAGAREDGSRNNHAYKDASEIIRVDNAWEAIIDRKAFEEVQRKMENRKKGPQPRRKGEIRYLLTGLVYCGECGSSIVGGGYRTARTGRSYFYTCTKRVTKACTNPTINRDWLEGLVLREAQEQVFSEKAITAMVPMVLKEIERRETSGTEELMAIRARIKDNETKISKLLDQVEDGIAGADAMLRIRERRSEIDALEIREKEIEHRPAMRFTEEMIRAYLQSFQGNLESADQNLKRKTLETFIERVEVFPEHVDIYLKFSPLFPTSGEDPENRVVNVGEGGALRTPSPHGTPLWSLFIQSKRANSY